MRAWISFRTCRTIASTSFPASSFSSRSARDSTSSFCSTTRPFSVAAMRSFACSSMPAASRTALGITMRPALSTEMTSAIEDIYAITGFSDSYGIVPFHGSIPGSGRLAPEQASRAPHALLGPRHKPLGVLHGTLGFVRGHEVVRVFGLRLEPKEPSQLARPRFDLRFRETQHPEEVDGILVPLRDTPLSSVEDRDGVHRRDCGVHCVRYGGLVMPAGQAIAGRVKKFHGPIREGSVPGFFHGPDPHRRPFLAYRGMLSRRRLSPRLEDRSLRNSSGSRTSGERGRPNRRWTRFARWPIAPCTAFGVRDTMRRSTSLSGPSSPRAALPKRAAYSTPSRAHQRCTVLWNRAPRSSSDSKRSRVRSKRAESGLAWTA